MTHYRRTGFALALLLTTVSATAFSGAATKQQRLDHSITRAHYEQLVKGSTPRLAELSLFVNLMPKGGDLHHHYSGALYAETYLDWVGQQGFCVNGGADASTRYRIETKPAQLSEPARAQCLSADAVRADNGFYRELLKRWSNKDFDNHHHEQPAPDQQFFDTFGYFGPVSGLAYRTGLLQLKARAQGENLGYLETMLRSAPGADLPPALADKLNALTSASVAAETDAVFAEVAQWLAQDAKAQQRRADYVKQLADAAQGVDDDTFRLRFQTYVSRNSAPAVVFAGLCNGFAASAQSPLLVGVNIVGPENGHVAMRDYALHMKMFGFLKRQFPGVRLSLHAGELALGMVPPEGLRSHIAEAVHIAGAARIGHGIDIAHEDGADALLDKMARESIAVEINLTSNAFILGVRDEAHPVRIYLRHGVPIVISTDDAGVSRNNLSGEYLLFASRYKPGYDELKRIVYASIRHSFLADADKRDELARLDRRFAEFEARIARMLRQLPKAR